MEAKEKTVFQEGGSGLISLLERLNRELSVQFGKLELWECGGRNQLTDWKNGEKVGK